MNDICENRDVYYVLVESPESSSLLEGPVIDGMIILQWMLNKVGVCELNLCGSWQEPVMGCCEHGNELSGSVNMGNCSAEDLPVLCGIN